MRNLEKIIEHFVENAPEWSIALALGLCFFAIIWVFFRIFAKKFTSSSHVGIRFLGNVFAKVNPIFLVIASIYLTIWLSPTPDKITNYAKMIFMVAFWIQFILIILTLVGLWFSAKQQSEQDGDSLTMFNAISLFLKLAAIVMGVLLVLQTLGFNVSTLIAGLGIGGIAVALAAQNILGDLFASVSILFDKPFVVGDVISTSDFRGTVEHIGLKTTTLRGDTGEQIICANSALMKSTVRNYKRMMDRKVIVQIGVVYELSSEKLASVSELIKNAIDGVESCKFERAHLKSFGDSAIIFEAVYVVLGAEMILYMDTQEKINLNLFQLFNDNGIGFAYPTQTVYNHNIKI